MGFFDRVPMAYRPMLEQARGMLPRKVADMLTPHFLGGISPTFVGLHYHDMTKAYPDVAANGGSYDNCAHACYAHNAADRRQTIVFPQLALYADPVATVLHEYGHLFDEATGFTLAVPETTTYSRSNRQEAVAEAFEIILKPPGPEWQAFCEAEQFRPFRELIGVE